MQETAGGAGYTGFLLHGQLRVYNITKKRFITPHFVSFELHYSG